MNRKIALAAIAGGLANVVGLLRGQEPQAPTVRAPAREPVSPRLGTIVPSQETTLTREVAEDLQRQINDLAKRLAAVEQTQATTVGFSKNGNDLVLAAPGNVSLKSASGVTVEGANINVKASAQLIQTGAMIMLN